jgi:hypothetical protein
LASIFTFIAACICPADESFTILQAHLARLEALENYDVIVHTVSEQTIKRKGKEPLKLHGEEHCRIVLSVDDPWAVNAIIKVFPTSNKIDLKTLKPAPNPSQKTEVRYFHSNVARVQDLGGHSFNPAVRDFWEFQSAFLFNPPIEFTCMPLGPWSKGIDRHTFLDEKIASLKDLKPVKTVGEDVILTWPSTNQFMQLSTYTMNRITETPVSMHIFQNKAYSGEIRSWPHDNMLRYEYKVINDIPLPIKKTVTGYDEEEIQGEKVRTEFSYNTEIKWLKVNDELEFPDVDSISRNYSNLYEYIFEEKP